MNDAINTIQATQRKITLMARFWIFITILLVVMVGGQFIPASYSYTSANGVRLFESNLFSTATANATGTREPTATKTPTSSSTPPATVLVSGNRVILRSGPDTNFSVIRMLSYADPLVLLGRSSDNTWLYVKTSDGQEGWVQMLWVDLAGAGLNNDFPVKTPSPIPPATVFVAANNVNLRTGPGSYYSSIRRLNYGEKLQLFGRESNNTWVFVKTSAGQEGWVKVSLVNLASVDLNHNDYPFKMSPPTETATPVVLKGIEGHWIDIDLSEQMLRAYDGTNLTASFLVSTGIDNYPTETGQYHIYGKYPIYTMTGNDYYLPDVPYSMFYSGDFSIHGTYWHHNFGTPMSHGCVNMDTKEAEWLYNWSSVGTLVNIHS